MEESLCEAIGGLRVTAATCLLLELSHDTIGVVTHELCDPLRPLLAVHLSSTAKGLWVAMQEQLAELRQRHAEAAAMARVWDMSCAALADAEELRLGTWALTLRTTSRSPSPTGGRWGCWSAAARCRCSQS